MYGAVVIALAVLLVLRNVGAWTPLPDIWLWNICIVFITVFIIDLAVSMERTSRALPARINLKVQRDIYSEVRELTKDRLYGTIRFYHYSAAKLEGLIEFLYERGWTIHLYVQDPEVPRKLGSLHQAARIEQTKTTLLDRVLPSEDKRPGSRKGKVFAYKSMVPLTVRAAIIDNTWIALGWYYYEAVPGRAEFPNDTVDIHGDDVAGVLIDRTHYMFRPAREFLYQYERATQAKFYWQYPPAPTAARRPR